MCLNHLMKVMKNTPLCLMVTSGWTEDGASARVYPCVVQCAAGGGGPATSPAPGQLSLSPSTGRVTPVSSNNPGHGKHKLAVTQVMVMMMVIPGPQ